MSTVDIRPFEDPDAATIARLSTTVQWPSLTNAETVIGVCTAPGAVAYVALSDDRLVGWAQAVGDSVLQSHLSFLAVHPDHRRRGIGRLLVVATFQRPGPSGWTWSRMPTRAGSTKVSPTSRWWDSGSTPAREKSPARRLSGAGHRRTGWCGPSRR
jgi:GNAT superfamily N-acetyltransferase